jgi:RHS repeat-associated protein
VAIIDLNTTEVDWYIHGNERVAKIDHQIDNNERTDIPDGCSHVTDKTKCTKFRGAVNPEFGSLLDVNLSQIENQRRLQSLQQVLGTDQQSGEPIFLFPDTLYQVKIGGDVRFSLEAGLSNLPPGAEIQNQTTLDHPRRLIPFTNNDQDTILLPLILALGGEIPRPPIEPNPEPETGDPFDIWIPQTTIPPLPHATYYIYDHLGNSRVVYTPNISCDGGLGSGNPDVTYWLNSVIDYFPYGKVLRQYVPENPRERFLTTYHERDYETGLDYRGARFYDSDVGRFLSLDPLAAKFGDLSPYNYVFSNPIKYIDPLGLEPQLTGTSSMFGNQEEQEEERNRQYDDGEYAVNAYIVNDTKNSEKKVNTSAVINETDRVFRKNGFGGYINYIELSSEAALSQLPAKFDAWDKKLFIAILDKADVTGEGETDIDINRGVIWNHYNGEFQSYESVSSYLFVSQSERERQVGFGVAHEYAHQMDYHSHIWHGGQKDFWRFNQGGGHYNGIGPNLLRGGAVRGSDDMLSPDVRSRILYWLKN